jgi:polysaccharide biosynthesis protein PelG
MAGIGWKLEKLLERESLGGAVGAFLTGVAVTSGPWLLTTLVLVLMRLAAVRHGDPGIFEVERVITLVYATVLVLSAPIDIVLSRFASDRVYEDRADAIAAPLRRALTATLLLFAVVGALDMLLIGADRVVAAGGVVLAVVVGGQWLLLSAAGGLGSPATILRAFAAGAPVSIIAATAMARIPALGAAGYLYGFAAGQIVTLGVLLWGTLRCLPAEEDESARLGPAFRDYAVLAAAAMLLQAGIWVDKLVVFLGRGGAVASVYAALAAIAWLSVVPTCAYLFLQVETRFYRRFRAYYAAVERGSSLSELEAAAAAIRVEATRVLAGTAAVQVIVTGLARLLAPRIVEALGMRAAGDQALRVLLLGATLQVVALCATLMLYYFDFRSEALAAAVVLLVGNGVFTTVGLGLVPLGTGYVLGCAASVGVALALLRSRLGTLLRDTYQSQPYGASA